MARSLVIVESPAKAKTINKYLGRDYSVKASYGHVMDLPKKTLGVLLPGDENGRKRRTAKGKTKTSRKAGKRSAADKTFEPKLEIIHGKKKIIQELRVAASSAPSVFLAGDPDREGEAICAHLAQVLSKPGRFIKPDDGDESTKAGDTDIQEKKESSRKKPSKAANVRPVDPKNIFRVSFNEITPRAIRAAFEHPRQLDTNLVDAQQARRILDRLVGYKISPLLWNKVRRGLSAGRVQTVALRMAVDREGGIEEFTAREHWAGEAELAELTGDLYAFRAPLQGVVGKKRELELGN